MGPVTIMLSEGYSDWEITPLAGVGRSFFGADIRFASPLGGPLVSAAGLPISDTNRVRVAYGRRGRGLRWVGVRS